MFSFWAVMYLIFVGMLAGFVARLLVPGRDAIGFWWTVLLGIAGSFAGGFVAWALFGWDEDEGALQPGGVIFSIIGAVLILLVWRAIDRRRSPTSTIPGSGDDTACSATPWEESSARTGGTALR